MTARLRTLILGLLVASPLAAAGGAAHGEQPLSPVVQVKTGVLGSLAEAPIFIAMERGYFKEEGLDIELVNFVNTATMTAPLSTGDLDVGMGAPTVGFFNAINRGIAMKLVADKGRNSEGHGFNALVMRKDLVDSGKVKTLADLKGMKIASPSRMSPVEIELEAGLRKVGLTIDDVNIEILRFPDMIAALGNGAIDGAMLIEPLVTLARIKKVGVRFKGVDEMYPDYQIAGILYGPRFVADKPEAAKRWVVAYLRGIRDFVDGMSEQGPAFDAIVKILTENTRAKNAKAYKMMVMPGFDPDGYLNLDSIRESMSWFEQRGGIKDRPPIEEFVDYSYLEYAHSRIGRRGPQRTVKQE